MVFVWNEGSHHFRKTKASVKNHFLPWFAIHGYNQSEGSKLAESQRICHCHTRIWIAIWCSLKVVSNFIWHSKYVGTDCFELCAVSLYLFSWWAVAWRFSLQNERKNRNEFNPGTRQRWIFSIASTTGMHLAVGCIGGRMSTCQLQTLLVTRKDPFHHSSSSRIHR